MRDQDLVPFLQWALPRMGLRWEGFRKPRGQVKKRLNRRLAKLGLDGLDGLDAYRRRLAEEPAEWAVLDALCRVTITRFHRDQRTFRHIGDHALPEAAERARETGRPVRVWSAGCASGEEPYTVSILWRHGVAPGHPETPLAILATDADLHLLLHRTRRACYPRESLRELPDADVERAFEPATEGDGRCLRPAYGRPVSFAAHDLRSAPPRGPFDLVLCRNLAFTYFANGEQRRVLAALRSVLRPGGWLALGSHEALPDETGWEPMDDAPALLRLVGRGR